MTENNTTIRSNDPLNENNQKQTEQEEDSKDLEIIQNLKNINIDSEDLSSLIKDLQTFESKLKFLSNVCYIFTSEVFQIFGKLIQKDNIKIHLILSRIYIDIISNDSLYNNYLMFEYDDSNKIEKVDHLLQLISDCTSLIEKLEGFVFDPKLFKFKNKTLDLLKCIYFNCKSKIDDNEKSKKLQELLDTLPPKFYSSAFTELNKNKDLYEVFKSQTQDKIASFEDKFLEINNYFEQFEVFRKFVENNSGSIKCTAINDENIGKNEEEENKGNTEADSEKIDFYQNYGLLLLKFCKYHNYVFLNKEEEKEDKTKDENNDDDNENARVVFLLDKFKQEGEQEENEEEKNDEEKKEERNEEEKKDENQINQPKKDSTKNQKIEKLLQNKQFHSVIDSKEYKTLIQKEINYYLKHTKNLENNEKLKSLREQMNYYINTLELESYVPLYLKDFSKITISDNFTPSFLTNVPAGKVNKLYLETKTNENMLVYIEFFLEDKSKDITFEVNKYDDGTNSFKQIFKEEKVEETYKFFILCNGYSLYEIIFNNDYSWFNSKDVNYRISLLKLKNKPKTEVKEGEICVNVNGKEMTINSESIDKKIENKEDENIINIPVILYLNYLRIGTCKKNENKEELTFKEIFEEDIAFIPKPLFEYQIEKHLKKQANVKDKRIIISIFSQNRNLSKTSDELEEKINSCKDKNTKEYLKKIGFFPNSDLEGIKVVYKLYDLCEQNLVYHLYLSEKKKISINKSLLFLKFDKYIVNYVILHEGNILTELPGKLKKNFNKNNIEEYAKSIIQKANDEYEGVDVILSYIDCNNEEEKNKLIEIFENINKYCQKLDSTSKVVIYDNDDINVNVFKYMNLFYDN